jgi:hypothetical protein
MRPERKADGRLMTEGLPPFRAESVPGALAGMPPLKQFHIDHRYLGQSLVDFLAALQE